MTNTDSIRQSVKEFPGENVILTKSTVLAMAEELDALRDVLTKIAATRTLMSEMCTDQSIRPSLLALAALNGVNRIARQVLHQKPV
jgi:hypothetical protein